MPSYAAPGAVAVSQGLDWTGAAGGAGEQGSRRPNSDRAIRSPLRGLSRRAIRNGTLQASEHVDGTVSVFAKRGACSDAVLSGGSTGSRLGHVRVFKIPARFGVPREEPTGRCAVFKSRRVRVDGTNPEGNRGVVCARKELAGALSGSLGRGYCHGWGDHSRGRYKSGTPRRGSTGGGST